MECSVECSVVFKWFGCVEVHGVDCDHNGRDE